MFKKMIATLFMALAVVSLSACGDVSNKTFGGGTKGVTQKLPDGRSVTCVVYGEHGITCDWAKAK